MNVLKLSCGFLVLFLISCGAGTSLQRVQKELEQYPEFSIVLADMKEEGNFFTDYYHRYNLIFAEKEAGSDSLVYRSEQTDWHQVERAEFEKYQDFLGMVIASKSQDGKISNDAYPAGYQYVGDSRYGEWRRDAGGNSFWAWYGRYALFSTMFGMFNRPISYSQWDDYRGYRRSGRPYYGPNREYGTRGSYTKSSNPTFFERRQRKEAARKARFSERVKQRTRRSRMSGFRSRRSGGFGK